MVTWLYTIISFAHAMSGHQNSTVAGQNLLH